MTTLDYEEILRYPTQRDDWLRTVLIGSALLLFGVLLVPALLAYGYVVAVLRRSVDGVDAPPAFEDWGDLLVDGLKAWAIGLVYMLVPAIVFALTVGGSALALATGTDAGAGAGVAGFLGGLALTTILVLAFGYVLPAALANFVHRDSLAAAFDAGALRDVALSRDYAMAWLAALVVGVAASVVIGVLSVVPFLGWLASFVVTFYAAVVAARLYGLGYADAMRHAEPSTSTVGTPS